MEYKLFDEYITLQALLKELSIIHSGGAIKGFLANNTVLFNGEDEKRRGKKLRYGDVITIPSEELEITIVAPTTNEIEEHIKGENVEKENLSEKYNYSLDERYSYILNKILDEKKLFISEKENNFIINEDSEAIKDLEISKDMNFEEIDFYVFYVNYLSKKEYENKKVLVGYNGTDGKEVTMSKFKEDINEIRDSRSTFKN